jgi:hypothetical protein
LKHKAATLHKALNKMKKRKEFIENKLAELRDELKTAKKS